MNKRHNNNNNAEVIKWIFARSKRYFPAIIIVSLFSAVISVMGIALAFVSKQVLDVATNHSNGNFYFYSLMLFAIIIPQILLNSVKTILIAVANGKLIISFRNHLFSYVVRKKYTEIAKHHSGDLLNRFTSDTDIVVTNTVSLLPSVASMVAQIVGGVLALILLDKRIAIIVFVFGITVPAFGRLINRKYIKLHKDCQETEGKSRSFMQECFENIVIIKSFISEAPITKKLNQLMYKNYKIKIKRSIISLVTHMGLYAFFTLGYFSVLIWGAGQISKGVITYGTLMAFLQVVGQLRAPMQNISGILPQYYSAIASAERLMEIEQGDKDLPPAEDESLNNLKQRFSYIEFDNVTFAYDDEPVLNDCSFVAKRGKITAITGESGSGKSTVLKIILGLYEPQSGRVTIDGETLLNTSHRGLFAYVPQGNLLLSGTIRENITLCDDSISNEEVMRAAKTAEIYDLINSMPEGLDTLLAERGAGLSEGQIQRISIARALLTNAPVLLLDEATSALDEATETKVLSNIRSFSDKTVLFVTHRNTSLKVCDKIIHIENKKFNVLKE